MGQIKKLQWMTGKGQPPLPAASVQALKDQGLSGDRFCDGSDRQVSILSEDVSQWMAEQEVQGLCFRRYKGNLLISGEDISEWKKGDLLRCGQAELIVTDTKKECFADCPRQQAGLACRLPGGCAYARVSTGGQISQGDFIGKQRKE